MEYINCNLCNSNKYKLFREINNYRLVKCKRCGLVYLNPRPAQQELNRGYNSEYYKKGIIQEDQTEAGIEKEIEKRLGRAREIIKISSKKKGKLLDIGCALGFFIACLKRYGWEVAGVESSEWSANFAKEKLGLNVFRGTIEEIEFTGYFNVITMYHLLEHLPNPLGILRKVSKILANDGLLVIKGPNLASFDRIWHGKNWWSYHLPFHFYHFTPRTYRMLLEKAGFSCNVIRCEYWDPILHLREIGLSDGIRADHSKSKTEQLGSTKKGSIYLQKIHSITCIVSKLIGLKGRDLTIYAKQRH